MRNSGDATTCKAFVFSDITASVRTTKKDEEKACNCFSVVVNYNTMMLIYIFEVVATALRFECERACWVAQSIACDVLIRIIGN